jgi:TonB-linked SusC/RagA family outer membrane protein
MVKKLLMAVLVAVLAVPIALSAQTGSVAGKVTDAGSGAELTGANVFIQQLSLGAVTDLDGNYTIPNVPAGTYSVRLTFVGYRTVNTTVSVVGGQTAVLNLTMNADLLNLDDLVVTAYGIARDEKSVGYSIQQVSASEVASIDQGNLVGALAGKVAGVQVIGSAGANIGGSEKIRIRGTNGLSDAQPLFVIDGTPVSNTSFSSATVGRDYGNLISDLNLQDVESISVLKGAAAAALYGNRASAGVIIINTKKGSNSAGRANFRVDFSNSTHFDNVSILPEYQNEYGGGYTQTFISQVDPRDGKTYNRLNYAADESWGPKMDGTLYRPWWSWYDHDFDGDGVNDYGKTIPLSPQPNNVRDFFDTGVRVANNLSISGGSANATFRLGVGNSTQNGVVPNSTLDRSNVSFNGSLNHNDRFTSSITFNYTNTKGYGRPAQGYSPAQGSVGQLFNQWFQRQLDLNELRQYRMSDGSIASWNMRSPTDKRGLYFDSPYFFIYENVATDDRNRFFGNFALSYKIMDNMEVTGKIHLDTYDLAIADRIGTGGLVLDNFSTSKFTNRENNYELGLRYSKDVKDLSMSGFFGANYRTETYTAMSMSTVGGLSSQNFFNIAASVGRPSTSNTIREKEVASAFGTVTLGFRDFIYVDLTGRNDWSSALPENNNSYFYYGVSSSLVFSELNFFRNQSILSFGKIRASLAQVGADVAPYNVFSSWASGTSYGTMPTQTLPNSINNPDLKAAISSDYEFGLDLRFLDGRVRTDLTYYQSIKEDEILSLTVPGSSGFSTAIVNAGKFTTKGWELSLAGTPVETRDFTLDFTLNWATSYSEVNKLADGLTARQLEAASFGLALFAREGEEWGKLVTTGSYGGYLLHENGQRIVNPNGQYARQSNKELGGILPDWTGGFRTDATYRNFALSAFIEFQKGGQFYSLSKMFGAYSGNSIITVGNNVLGNPQRDPVLNAAGQVVASVLRANAAPNSGGVLVSGVNAQGQPVEYLTQSSSYWPTMFFNKEEWLFDATYVKLKEVKLTYNVPTDMLRRTPLKRASLSLDMYNVLLLYATTPGVDPSTIQNGTAGFSFWEGGGLPNTRSIGFNINVGL